MDYTTLKAMLYGGLISQDELRRLMSEAMKSHSSGLMDILTKPRPTVYSFSWRPQAPVEISTDGGKTWAPIKREPTNS